MKKILSSHDFFQLSRTTKSKKILLYNEAVLFVDDSTNAFLMSQVTFKKINCLVFFITNRHRFKKACVVFIHSFGRKKDADVFFNFSFKQENNHAHGVTMLTMKKTMTMEKKMMKKTVIHFLSV